MWFKREKIAKYCTSAEVQAVVTKVTGAYKDAF